MPVRIRTYQPGDFPQLLAWSTQTAWEQIPPASRPMVAPDDLGRRVRAMFHQAMRSPRTRVFVAEESGEGGAPAPVGYVGVAYLADELTGALTGHVFDLYVAPERRRRGLGRALLEAAEADCRTQGAARASATVSVHNAASLGLFAGSGFLAERQLLGKRL